MRTLPHRDTPCGLRIQEGKNCELNKTEDREQRTEHGGTRGQLSLISVRACPRALFPRRRVTPFSCSREIPRRLPYANSAATVQTWSDVVGTLITSSSPFCLLCFCLYTVYDTLNSGVPSTKTSSAQTSVPAIRSTVRRQPNSGH